MRAEHAEGDERANVAAWFCERMKYASQWWEIISLPQDISHQAQRPALASALAFSLRLLHLESHLFQNQHLGSQSPDSSSRHLAAAGQASGLGPRPCLVLESLVELSTPG